MRKITETTEAFEESNVIIKNKNKIEDAIKDILTYIGEDSEREGLAKTPERVGKMYAELLEGYSKKLKSIVNGAIFELDTEQTDMIIIDNIEFSSMCEHHMLPFLGKVHVAYIPNQAIIGLSKIPRIVDMFAKRLQIQERLTSEILDAISEILKPKGVIVYVEAEHFCAALRGVKKRGVQMKTIAQKGIFREDRKLKDEFLSLINKR